MFYEELPPAPPRAESPLLGPRNAPPPRGVALFGIDHSGALIILALIILALITFVENK